MSMHVAAAQSADLITESHFSDPQKTYFYGYSAGDDFYEALIAAHTNLSEAESHALNARLVLILANHIGSLPVLKQALQAAAVQAK
ncbi:MAG: hypothetical protein RL258_967 [Pseudomonadota bacterium]|jgi:hypothetical protein